MNRSAPELSVVIPVRNGARYAPTLCAALERQTLEEGRFEVIFVDDGSDDGTREFLARWTSAAPSRRLLYAGGKGPAHARNVGTKAAHGEWVTFTDADTVPDDDWLASSLQALQTLKVVAIEGAVYVPPDDPMGPYTHQAINAHGGMYMTANMTFSRRMLLDLGGFDERFELPSVEDRELAIRVLASGAEIPFVPEARVRHHVVARTPLGIWRETRRLSYIGLLHAKYPDLPKEDRDVVRVLNHIDIDILLAWIGMAGIRSTRGIGCFALSLFVANGVRRALGSGRVLHGPVREAPVRAMTAMTLPIAKAARCIQGALRFRTIYW